MAAASPEELLAVVERCAPMIFEETDAEARGMAEMELFTAFTGEKVPGGEDAGQLRAGLLQSISVAACIPQHKEVLRSSKDAYALLFAAQALVSVVTSDWSHVVFAERNELRQFCMEWLADNSDSDSDGGAAPTFVVDAVIQLVCRISKMGWTEDYRLHGTVDDASRLLLGSPPQRVSGLRVFSQLVNDMQRDLVATFDDSLTWILFRDIALQRIFGRSIAVLRHLRQCICKVPVDVGFGDEDPPPLERRRSAGSDDGFGYKSPPRPPPDTPTSGRSWDERAVRPFSVRSPPQMPLHGLRRPRRLSADDADTTVAGLRDAFDARATGSEDDRMFATWEELNPDDPVTIQLLEEALQVVLACLSYNFAGSAGEFSIDDDTTPVSLPSSWDIVRSPGLPGLFFDLFHSCFDNDSLDHDKETGAAPTSLAVLSQVASIRPSFYDSDVQRARHTDALLIESQTVMLNLQRRVTEDNHYVFIVHQACTLLQRIKLCTTLAELACCPDFPRWLGVASEFTNWSFNNWTIVSQHSSHYLLQLWAQIVKAAKNHAEDDPTLAEAVPQIVKSFLWSRLEMSEEGDDDGMLSEEGVVQTQMEAIASVCRFRLSEACTYICDLFSEQLDALRTVSPEHVPAIQRKLTWMTYCVGAMARDLLGSSSASHVARDAVRNSLMENPAAARRLADAVNQLDVKELKPLREDSWLGNVAEEQEEDETEPEEDRLDSVARLLWMPFRVLLVMRGGGTGVSVAPPLGGRRGGSGLEDGGFRDIEDVLEGLGGGRNVSVSDAGWDPRGATESIVSGEWTDERVSLEAATLYFIETFRAVYVSEQAADSAAERAAREMGFNLGPLAAAAASVVSLMKGRTTTKGTDHALAGVVTRVGTLLHLAQPHELLDLIVGKLVDTLRTGDGRVPLAILRRSLGVFNDFAAGVSIISAPNRPSHIQSSGEELLRSSVVRSIVASPLADQFPSLCVPHSLRLRTALYSTLARLLFLHAKSMTTKPLSARRQRRRQKSPRRSPSRLKSSKTGRSTPDLALSPHRGVDDSGSEAPSASVADGADTSELFVFASGESGWFIDFMEPLASVGGELDSVLKSAEDGGAEAIEAGIRPQESGGGFWLGDELKIAIVGWFRDLRGVVSAAQTSSEFIMIFDWFFPLGFDPVMRCIELFYNHPTIMVPLLRFAVELAFNRTSRIRFPSISANGIVLFRAVSACIIAYGNRVLASPEASSCEPGASEDPYRHRLKPTCLAITAGLRLISGSYANRGILELYEDRSFEDVRRIMLQLVLSISLEELAQYAKVRDAVFPAIEGLIAEDADYMLCLDPSLFSSIMERLVFGVRSTGVVSSFSCGALNTLASKRFEVLHDADGGDESPKTESARREMEHRRELSGALRRLEDTAGGAWASAMFTIFETLLYDPQVNKWTLARPLLPLILMDMDGFRGHARAIAEAVPRDILPIMESGVERLLDELEPTVDGHMRRAFTTNMYSLVHAVRPRL